MRRLTFRTIGICCIETAAFDMPSFHQLEILSIFRNSIYIIDCQPDVFRGLTYMDHLRITEESNRVGFPADFLGPVRKILKQFYYVGLVLNHQSLTNLFGGERMRLLATYVHCGRDRGNTNFIDADNFTALVMVTEFAMHDCGLEFIMPGTFDELYDTLHTLLLLETRLLQFDIELFRKFFDVVPWTCSKVLSKHIHLGDRDLMIRCSDDYYAWRNWSAINGIDSQTRCIGDATSAVSAVGRQTKQYVKYAQRFTHTAHPRYAFPKFIIHYDATDGIVIVTQMNDEPFRILFWSMKAQGTRGLRCPHDQEDREHVRCWRWQNETAPNLSESMIFYKPDAIIVCVILEPSLRKQAIPLQCATIRLPIHDATFAPIQWLVLIGILIGHSLIVSFIIIIYIMITIWMITDSDTATRLNEAPNMQ